MMKRGQMVVVGCTIVALLAGCGGSTMVVKKPEQNPKLRCLNELMDELEQRANYQGYTGVIRMVPVIRNKQTGTVKSGITKDNALMQARGDLAARVSALVARQMKGTYREVALQDVSDVEETLTRTLNEIAVERLAYTEVLAERYRCDHYGVALGMRNEDFRGLAEDLYKAGTKALSQKILPQKNLTPEQTAQVERNAEEQQKELGTYIQRFLNKPMR